MESTESPYPYERLEEYAKKYSRIRLEREDGILTVTFHKDGGEFVWSTTAHRETSNLWNDIGLDPENRVIILTGSGEAFLRLGEYDDMTEVDPWWWVSGHHEGKRLMQGLLEIEQPIIAALNGPVDTHSQIPLVCDVIIATEDTVISDSHLPAGIIPCDGHHIVWPMVFGLNRARYLFLTQQAVTAQEAKEWGVIGEVVTREELMPRAREIARKILELPPVTARLFRPLLLQQFKRTAIDGMTHGLLGEGYSIMNNMAVLGAQAFKATAP